MKANCKGIGTKFYGDDAGNRMLSQWNALKAVIPLNLAKDWQFNLRPQEARNVTCQFHELRDALSDAATTSRITFVPETENAFLGYGWWLGTRKNLPNFSRNADGKHEAGTSEYWNVHEWHPYRYEKPGRALRTGNDSVLTQTRFGAGVYGTAHPNLIGHTLLADGISKAVTKLLDKH